MNVFPDSSVLLAACGSAAGASRAVVGAAAGQGWNLLTSSYVLAEVETNLVSLPAGAPGLRKDHAPNCYAAFLLAADGNNVEAVCMG